MNVLTNWIHTPAAGALGWTIFHSLWEGAAIAAALWAALRCLKSSRGKYAAACLALAAMLAVWGGTFARVLPQQPRPGAVSLRLPPRPGADSGDLATRASTGLRAEDLLPWAAPVWLAGVLLLHLR